MAVSSLADVLTLLASPAVGSIGGVLAAVLVLVYTITWVQTYQVCDHDGTSLSWGEKCQDNGIGGTECLKYGNCIFNWHPILMVASMIFGTTCAALSYQLPAPKKVTKPIHYTILCLAFPVLCAGLHAVFKYHDTKPVKFGGPIPNMTSLHSYLGIFTVVFFSMQLVCGLYHFIPGPDSGIPGVNAETKGKYKVLHVTAGLLSLALPILTAASGMQEKTEFVDRFGQWVPDPSDASKWTQYNPGKFNQSVPAQVEVKKAQTAYHSDELSHLNWMGILMLLQLILVVFAVRNRKKSGPSEGALETSLVEPVA